MQYTEQLHETYEAIKALPLHFEIEPYEVVDMVHQYRMYWKPQAVKTLLLAESHVFTQPDEFNTLHHCADLENYPENFVRFVYCLSYGDNSSLLNPINNRNGGTPQYWKLFSETVSQPFRVANNPDNQDKRSQKIALLKEMQEAGIWLMDCSIVGVYVSKGDSPSINEYNQILSTSFEKFCLPIIQREQPDKVIVVGQRVYSLIKSSFDLPCQLDWIHQPNAMVTNEKRRTLAKIGYLPYQRQKPLPQIQKLSVLFSETPSQFGFRGDDFLWQELVQLSHFLFLPKHENDLEHLLLQLISNLIGQDITAKSDVFVERYNKGGLSSGLISSSFWIENLIPGLKRKLKTIQPV